MCPSFQSMLRAPRSTLFPYTTLFRSDLGHGVAHTPPRFAHVLRTSVLARRLPHAVASAGCSQVWPHPGQSLVKLTKGDRKSTRLNSSHMSISYAVFCLKKKRTQ